MKTERSVQILSSLIAVFLTAFVVFAGYQSLQLNTEYSVREFFPKDHPILNNDEETARRFQLAERPIYLIALSLHPSEQGTWLTPSRVNELEDVTKAVSEIKGIKSVRSLANLEMALDQGDTLQVGPILKTLPPAKWAEFIRSQALLKSQLISEDLRSVLLAVEPQTIHSSDLLRLDRDLVEKSSGPGWKVHLAGVPAVQGRLGNLLGSEIAKFLGLSLIFFCLMFFFFYKNFRPVLFAAVGLIVTNLTSLMWISLTGTSFTILLSTLPIIVSIAFVSIAIHTFHLWADRAKQLHPEDDALIRFKSSLEVLREIALPNFLGSCTTAIGFAVLVSANIPAIQTYAVVTAIMVMWTWFITQILLIGFQHFLVPVPRKWNHARAWWMLRLNRWSMPVIALTIGSCLVLGPTIPKINFSGRLFDDLPKTEAVRAATEKVDEKFGGTVAFDVALNAQRADAWKDPVLLHKLEEALHKVRTIPGLGSALSVTDFMGAKVPASAGAIAEIYFLFSMSSENPLVQYVNSDFSEIRVATRLRDLPSAQIERIRSEVRDILSAVSPQLILRESGLAVNSHTVNQEVAKQLVYGFWHSLVIIGLLLMVIFRSIRWAILACLPNFVPPAILIGTLVFFQTPVKPGIALIFSIALGLAFNNTVYLLSRLKRIQAEKRMNTLPLRRALLEEGNPCFSESLIMLVGFLIFLTSDFKLNQTFGAYMILSIIVGAIADLIFLPAILREFSSILWSRTSASSAWLYLPLRSKTITYKLRGVAAGLGAIIFFAILIVGSLQSQAAEETKDEVKMILDKARAQLDSKNDQANVRLKIIEPNGETKSRDMTLQTMRTENGFKALIRIQAPADIKGTALLAEVDKGEERQFLYLPSSKQVRRVASATKSTGVLGSELSPEDLNAESLKGAKAKLVKKDQKTAVIEVTPTPGTSEYTKVLTTFSMPQSLPEKTEYYVGDKLKKTVEFQNYKTIGGKSRAQLIRVKNVEKNRGTDIELTNLKVNTNLSAKSFTQDALKDTW